MIFVRFVFCTDFSSVVSGFLGLDDFNDVADSEVFVVTEVDVFHCFVLDAGYYNIIILLMDGQVSLVLDYLGSTLHIILGSIAIVICSLLLGRIIAAS